MAEVGVRFEDAATAGVSHFLEHMLHRGTRSFSSAHALACAIEGLGATLDAATGVDRGSLVMTTPPDNALEAIRLLGEVVTSPSFADIDVERGIVREELLEDRDDRGRLVDPDGIVRSIVFGEHPLGLPIVGTPRTLRRFDVPMLRAHHARHYGAATTALAVSGKLPPRSQLSRALEQAFAGVAGGARPRVRRFRPSAAGRPVSLTRSHSSQASIRVACVGPGRRDARSSIADLLIRVVDDGNATRLYERLCDRRGLCYDVSAGYEAYDEAGLFDVAAESAEGACVEVLSEILSMLAELASAGPSDAEVERALSRARWHADRSLDQAESVAEIAALGVLGGEPLTAKARAERMAVATPAKVRALARRMFRPEALTVSVGGAVSRKTAKALDTLGRAHGVGVARKCSERAHASPLGSRGGGRGPC